MKAPILWTCSALLLLGFGSAPAAIRNLPGFSANTYGANDDGTYPCTGTGAGVPGGCTPTTVPIGFSLNFYGNTVSDLYLNNNGNVTFDSPLSEYTPFGLPATATQIIAPYFADVDTRAGNLVTFGNDTVDGHPAFGVNWIGVGYFSQEIDKLNSFQLILINRSDRNAGDFDIEFNYDQVQWETGDASGGTAGLGGSSAVVGFSNGSGLPGTSFQLHGSLIPGQFLDSNPGGLIHRSLNSTVLGRYVIPIINLSNTVLNVTRFSQGDPRWAANTYANSTYTIQQKGCALSSLAMALNFAGVSTDPGALNTLMNNDGDFVGTGVNWTAATRDASGDSLEFHAFRTTDTQYLSQTLANGYPIIVGVNLNDQGEPSHFVLVIGYQNGQFLINDPGHADATTLAAYNNQFETRGYVSDPPGDVSGMVISVDNPADLLVVDPLGRRTGLVSGLVLEESPQAFHFSDTLEDSDATGAPGTDTAHQVDFYEPMQGTYQVFVLGEKPGNYKLRFRSFGPTGAPMTPLTFQGSIAPGGMVPLQVNLGAASLSSQPFTNLCPWTATPTNGSAPLTVQFNAPGTDTSGNAIIQWNWSFGDGSIDTGQTPSHTYNAPGTFFPNLTVVNSLGNTIVGAGPAIVMPTVQFTATPSSGSPPLTVQFNCPSTDTLGLALTGWSWDFGDGSTATQQNPSHTYLTVGSFSPTLVATDSAGSSVAGVGPIISTLPSSGLVVNGGFESGNLSGWTESGNSGNAVISTDPLYVHSGTYGVELGPVGALGYLSQVLPTTPGKTYLISLWMDSPDGQAPNEFSVAWNGTTLFDQLDIPAIGWTNIQLLAQSTSSATTLSLGFQDDPTYLGLDEVAVYPVQPLIAGIHLSGRDLVLDAQNGLQGHSYAVLRSPNAALPLNQWTPIATNFPTASGNFSITVTNAVDPTAPQRFFILKLQ